MGRRVRLATAAAVLASISLVACDGGSTGASGGSAPAGAASASAAPSPSGTPETSPSAQTSAGSSATLELDDDAQACVDAFVAFLADVEDLVEAFDFEHASLFDYRDFIVAQEPAGQELYDRVKGDRCAEAGGAPPEELLPYIRERVDREAPRSMPYLDLLLAMKGLRTAGICERDQATLLRYLRDGGTVSDLPVPEKFHVFSLAASIDFTCGLRGAATFFDRDDVARFLEVI
jgi:hypothetical protein